MIPKAIAALERYGHQVVIGNELHRRKYEIVFVSRSEDDNDSKDPALTTRYPNGIVASWLKLPEDEVNAGREIEADIVKELVRRHTKWIEKGK